MKIQHVETTQTFLGQALRKPALARPTRGALPIIDPATPTGTTLPPH